MQKLSASKKSISLRSALLISSASETKDPVPVKVFVLHTMQS
jgi:hypothetical protein